MKSKKIAVIHDDMSLCGGAERVAIILAKELNADIITFSIAPYMRQFIPKNVRVRTLVSTPIEDKDDLIKRYKFSKLDLRNDYSFFIFSGNAAICAAAKNKPNLFYCNNVQKEVFDERIRDFLRSRKQSLRKKLAAETYLLKTRWRSSGLLRNGMDFIAFLISQNLRMGKLKYFSSRLTIKSHLKNLNHLQKIMVNSKNIEAMMKLAYGKDSEVLYPPVFTKQYNHKKAKNYWLSINRIHPYKRIDMQLEAFSRLLGEQLYVIGQIQDLEYYKNLLKMKPKNVSFLGISSNEELLEKFSKCKGLIHTSVNEDFGIAPVEAMASGKPVIGANEGGLKETVLNNLTGKLIDDINAEKLVEAILEVGKNPEKYETASIEQAKKFDTKIYINQLKKFIPDAK